MKKYDEIMMQTAELFSKKSYAKRLQVGAVLAKEGRILITGYNGTISGMSNDCEYKIYYCPGCGKENEDFRELMTVESNYDSHKNGQLVVATHSTCKHCGHQLGTMITKKDEMFTSFNCFGNKFIPITSDMTNIPFKLITKETVLHAEENIICFAAKQGISTDGCDLFVTHSPCKDCARLIAQSGIKRVVYGEEYRDLRGVNFLRSVGIVCEKFEADKK